MTQRIARTEKTVASVCKEISNFHKELSEGKKNTQQLPSAFMRNILTPPGRRSFVLHSVNSLLLDELRKRESLDSLRGIHKIVGGDFVFSFKAKASEVEAAIARAERTFTKPGGFEHFGTLKGKIRNLRAGKLEFLLKVCEELHKLPAKR